MKSLKILSVLGTVNQESLSEKLNNEIVKQLMHEHPNSTLTRLDTSNSQFANNSLTAANFDQFFKDVESDKWIEQLHNSDVLVLSTPMTNFSYSAGIKNFIDAIAVANKTFSYKYSTKGGSVGLLKNLKVVILATQGAPLGWYPFAGFVDTLKGIFEFFGVKQIETLLVDGNKVEPRSKQSHEQIIAEVKSELDKIVQKLEL
ncbi:FMN-dependent NADH-azoreductase [Mycoplasmopsis phocirhinis]|uniref:FMN dependent NADH:quinone oxidoreductase n=1 Tax=Mycoplasmopsis phocirhinis TaxID=142650 RepID=A0A4P6MLV2_9BACT|nr:FMN-dependent NADH-azoreductase [Mycoplasmopsis phocirhinis]QBF34448.1 FMN-dependent NADH-azoreductase [Mycoplasmopsis phocirhinis]